MQETAFAASVASLRWLGKIASTRTTTRSFPGRRDDAHVARGLVRVFARERLIELPARHHDEIERAADRRPVGDGEEHAAGAGVERQRLEQRPGAGRDAHRPLVERVGAGRERDARVGVGQPGALVARRRDDLGAVGRERRAQAREGVLLGEMRDREHGREVDDPGEHESADGREEELRPQRHEPHSSRTIEGRLRASSAAAPDEAGLS